MGIPQAAYRDIAVVEDVCIQVAVLVIVEEGGVGTEPGFGQVEFFGFFGKGEVPVVNVKVVVMVVTLQVPRITYIDIE